MTGKDEILKFTTKIYENSSEIGVLQEKLDNMLSNLDQINLDYNKGRIPKDVFEKDNKKLRKQSIDLIKSINKLVNDNLNCLKLIKNQVSKIEKEKVKKEIKKKGRAKKTTEKINIQRIDNGSSIYQIAPTNKS